MLNIWTQNSGYDFGIFLEQVDLDLPLPVTGDAGVTYTVISGALPGGLNIIGNHIKGNPFIVNNLQKYQFCIRASLNGQISDRTFAISINGINEPIFTTPAGSLAIGPSKQFYALNGSYVSYQLTAEDLNTAIGNTLRYFISSGDGKLPPGLTLSDTGLISGYIKSNLILTPEAGTGEYDESYFDLAGYDFAQLSTDGFDSYRYDNIYFDYNQPSVLPKSLNANYQFKVTVTDGITVSQRVFKIFVLGDDQFRADSTSLDGFAGQFTSDSTFLRSPVWLSNSVLGTFRSNNYLTVPVLLYDNTFVQLRLETTNCEVYALTKRVSLRDNIIGSTQVTIVNPTVVPVPGQYFTFDNYVTGASSDTYEISSVTSLGSNLYRLVVTSALTINLPELIPFYIGSLSKLPPGTNFDIGTGEIYGRVPYQPSVTESYYFTITATRYDATVTEQVSSFKTFSINILGSITSQITWTSPSNLGSIPAGYPCMLNVNAFTNVSNTTILYTLADNSDPLPFGLELKPDGEIVGTPNQFYDATTGTLGITTFDNGATTFDASDTTFDKTFTFTVKASNQYQYSAITKDFSITITTPNTVPYSNITTQPFLAPTQRASWHAFINNANIFDQTLIYRPTDSTFGVQTSLKMLVYAGIQTETAGLYVSAMGLGFKKKQFRFGSIKTATAIDPITQSTLYEVVYMQMIDPLESNGMHLPLSFQTQNLHTIPETADETYKNLTVDGTGYIMSDPNPNTFFPSSITNWQERLSTVGLSERNYLPLWMRSIQSGTKSELGYVLCVPLAFCKPGKSNTLVSNITASGFDFKTLDYTVDRFTISAVTGYSSDKYLVFRDDRITV